MNLKRTLSGVLIITLLFSESALTAFAQGTPSVSGEGITQENLSSVDPEATQDSDTTDGGRDNGQDTIPSDSQNDTTSTNLKDDTGENTADNTASNSGDNIGDNTGENYTTNTTAVNPTGTAPTYGPISYDLDGGVWDTENTVEGSATVTADAPLILPVPKKEGSVFLGWYVNNSFTSSVEKSAKWKEFATVEMDGSVSIDVPTLFKDKSDEERNALFSNLTFYAKWGEGKVVYASNFNSAELEDTFVTQELAAEQLVDNSQEIIILKENTFRNNGCSFAGWNTKADGTGTNYTQNQELTWKSIKEDINTNAAENILILYATWTTDGLTITYDADGGVFAFNEKEKETVTGNAILPGSTYYMPGGFNNTFLTPKRPGYSLVAWSTQKNGNGSKYKLDKPYTNTLAAGATKTLYAVWSANTYSFDYDLGGGTNNSKNTTSFTVGATTRITLNNPTKTGYVFTGWDSPDPTVKVKIDDLEANRGTNTSIILPVESWRTEGILDGLETSLTIPLKATWRKVTYTVNYNLNGAEAEFTESAFQTQLAPNENGNVTYTYGECYLAPIPKREGYTFVGWGNNTKTANFKPSATGTIEIQNLASIDAATVTLYAIWTAKSTKAAPYTYDLIYRLNDTTGNAECKATFATGYYADNTDDSHRVTTENNSADIIVSYDYGVKYTTPMPKRAGYEFVGWSTAPTDDVIYKVNNSGAVAISNIAKTKEEADASKDEPIALYAVWKRSTYSVSYDLDHGTKGENSPISFTVPEDTDAYQITTISVPQPKKKHSVFEGWYLDEAYTKALIDEDYATINAEGDTQITLTNMVKTGILEKEKALTLYAKFRAIEYEVVFQLDAGEGETFTDKTIQEQTGILSLNAGLGELSGRYAYGTKYEAPNAKKEGFVLKGWKNTSTGRNYRFNYKNQLFFKNLSQTDYNDTEAETIVFEPIWAARSYSINYVTKVGRNILRNPKSFRLEDEDDTITIYGLSAVGYEFNGWDAEIEFEDAEQESIITKDASANTLTIKTKELIKTGLLDETGTLTLVAEWDAHHYTIHYNGNGGYIGTDKDYCSYGTAYKLPSENDAKRAGYTLTGWSRTPAGGRDYLPGNSVRNLTSEDGASITLYAYWQKNANATKNVTVTSCEAVGKNIEQAVSGFDPANANVNVDYDIEVKALAEAYTSVNDDTYYLVAVNQNTKAIEYVFPTVTSNDDALAGTPTYGLTVGEISDDTTLVFDLDLIVTTVYAGYYKHTKAKPIVNGKEVGTEVYVRPIMDSFGIAERDASGTYKLISDAKYVSHPENIAYTNAFEKGATKKGIQGASYLLGENDTNDLQVDHVFLNIYASQVIQSGPAASGNYEYNGKWYTFNDPVLPTVKACNDRIMATDPDGTKHSVSVTVQVMLDWNNITSKMVHSRARSGGHFLYSWENNQQEGREMIEAMFNYLGESEGTMNWIMPGYVSNWIIGNEVNSYRAYQYSGSMSTDEFYLSYAETFRTAYNAIKSTNGSARIYVCADQCWNSPDAGYTSKSFLDNFNTYMNRLDPSVDWNIAFHPYAHPLMATNFWNNSGVTNTVSTPYITMNNISVLTDYATTTLKHADGTVPRIILSELGYSRNNGDQAAALAYTYAIAANNPNIDAIMIRSLVDESSEAGMGFGISKPGPNLTLIPYRGYNAYKYISEDDEYSKTQMNNMALWKKINSSATGWASLIKDFIENCLFTNNSY